MMRNTLPPLASNDLLGFCFHENNSLRGEHQTFELYVRRGQADNLSSVVALVT